jgi:tetratricopeptide (TPR) repeat protein
MASPSDTENEELPWHRRRSQLAVSVLLSLMFGAAMHLGGAGMLSVALWSPVAMIALALVGFAPALHRRDLLLRAALIFIGVTALQLVPLPPALLRAMDSQLADWSARALVPLRMDRSTQWRALHADPGNGYSDLQYAVGALAAFLAATRLARRGAGEQLVRGAAAITTIVALIGFGHKLGAIDKLFGFYSPFETSPPELLTPIINQNHLSNYLGIGSLLCVGLASNATALPLRFAYGIAAFACVSGAALSFSRAGVASTIGAHVMLAAWLAARAKPRRKGVTKQRHARLAMLSAALGGAAIALVLFFSWPLLQQANIRNDTTKLSYIWAGARVAAAHPLFGSGSGAAYAVITADGREPGVFTAERAESLPVDLALAVGPLIALVLCVLGVVGLWRIRPSRKSPAWVNATACAVAAAIVHNLLDFSLWLGATGYLVAVLAGVLAGESSRDDQEESTSNRQSKSLRFALSIAAMIVAAAGITTSKSAYFVDRARVRERVQHNGDAFAALQVAMTRHPADAYLALLGAKHALQRGDRRAGRFINHAMWLAPRWPAPHELIAKLFLLQGRREQALIELRIALERDVDLSGTLFSLVVSVRPNQQELARIIPTTPRGDALLRSLSASPVLVEAVDAVILERSATNPDALFRVAARAQSTPEGKSRAREIYQSILRTHPEHIGAARSLSRLMIEAGQLAEAEVVLTRTQARTSSTDLFYSMATLHARRDNPEAMRRVMQQWLERVSSDFDERARVLGLLGELELGMRSFGAAFAAFEQADIAAGENHPYIGRIVEVARQSGDVPRWRGACARLRELTATDDPRRAACDNAPPQQAPAVAP